MYSSVAWRGTSSTRARTRAWPYAKETQAVVCLPCPPDTSIPGVGTASLAGCTNRCKVDQGEEKLCDRNAICLFHAANNT